jgi:hypothetical protein
MEVAGMKRARSAVIGTGVAVVAALLLFPPFMVVDSAAARIRHAALGHHPFWNPPTPAVAEEALAREVGPPPAASSLDIGINWVRLAAEMIVTVVAVAAAWFATGRRRGEKRSRPRS